MSPKALLGGPDSRMFLAARLEDFDVIMLTRFALQARTFARQRLQRRDGIASQEKTNTRPVRTSDAQSRKRKTFTETTTLSQWKCARPHHGHKFLQVKLWPGSPAFVKETRWARPRLATL